jgi:hypothetical protein
MFLPADVANQALDAAGVDFTIGDLEEGTKPAQVLLRQYGICLRALLRAAHWDFARVQLPLTLLADATGQTANVGQIVPIPWTYEYLYPADCMKLRFIPWNYGQNVAVPAANIQIPNTPLTTAPGPPWWVNQRIRPSRFLIGTDPNYPSQPGQLFWEAQGESPAGSTVIMSNVQNATAIYTRFMPYPNTWDALFRSAMVAYLASEIVMPLQKDKKLAMTLRNQQIEIAKAKIKEARVIDGNEGFYSSDVRVDWMATRRGRGYGGPGWGGWGGGDDGPGMFFGAYDACGFADGSAY